MRHTAASPITSAILATSLTTVIVFFIVELGADPGFEGLR
jgi:multidrug efflux pump subunit AcrB